MRLHQALNPDQWLDLGIQPVTHELKLSIWGDKTDGPIILKPGEPDALVEFNILHFNRFPSRRATRGLEHDFIVQPQPKLRHPTEVAFHLDRAQNLRAKNIAVRRDEEIQRLDNIEEDFVLAVPYTLASP